MARTREQVLQEQLGALAFQNAILLADLEAAQERLKAIEAASAKQTAPADPPASGV